MLTTVLDCLCKAGVLVNDNVAHCNGPLAMAPAVIDENEPVEITLTTRQ